MAGKIILSGKERASRPLIAFLMSLVLTGTGEFYSGNPQRGILLALLRSLSCLAVPFYSILNPENIMLEDVFAAVTLFLFISIFSPLSNLYFTLKKKKIFLTEYNTRGFFSVFIIVNIIITALSIIVFSGSFTFFMAKKGYPPFIEAGDILVIKKIGNTVYNKSDLVMYGYGKNIIRIIGIPGEDISYSKGRFSINNSELTISIFNDMDIKNLSLTDYNVIAESNWKYRYPVIQNKDKLRFNYKLYENEYFAAPDDRNETSAFQKIKQEDIKGRVEGILYSFKRTEFIIPPNLLNE